MKEKIIKSGVISTIGAILAAVPIMGYLPFGAPYAAAMICSYCYRLPGVLAMVASVLYTQTKMLGIKYALLILAIACVILLLEEQPQNRFLTFVNIETGKVNVIYKLKDNKNFGLIEPEA